MNTFQSITEIGLTNRTCNVLRRNGVHYVGDLMQLTRDEMISWKSCGKSTVDEIIAKIEELNNVKTIVVEEPQVDFTASLVGKEIPDSVLEKLTVKSYRFLVSQQINTLDIFVGLDKERLSSMTADEDVIKDILASVNRYIKENKPKEEVKKVQVAVAEPQMADQSDDVHYYVFNPEYRAQTVKYVKKKDVDISSSSLPDALKRVIVLKANCTKMSQIFFKDRNFWAGLKGVGDKKVDDIVAFIEAYLQKHAQGIISYCNGDESVLFDDETTREDIINLYSNTPFGGYSLSELMHALELDVSLTDKVKHILGSLIGEGLLEYVDYRCYRVYPSFFEFIDECETIKEREKEIIRARVSGEFTLEEIGKKFGVTRERIRQIEVSASGKIKKILLTRKDCQYFDEDYYKYLYANYDFDKETAAKWLGISELVFGYLKTFYKRPSDELKELSLAVDDSNIEPQLKAKITAFLMSNKFEVDGKLIDRNRLSVLEYVMSVYCRENVKLDAVPGFYDAFVKSCDELSVEDPKLKPYEIKRLENIFRLESHKVLYKYPKTVRYYDMDSYDFTELLETIDLKSYQNTEVSTLKFINDYPELMKKYDIRDCYELHNLLNKIVDKESIPGIDLSRMPMIKFGEVDRETLVVDLLLNNAPISKADFLKLLNSEYGFDETTASANLVEFVKQYENNGMYEIDMPQMSESEMQALLNVLKEDFYRLDELKSIYLKNIPNADLMKINSFTLRAMGFDVLKTCVLRNFSSLKEYFTFLLKSKTPMDIKKYRDRFSRNISWYTTLQSLRDSYEIIELDKDVVIARESLESDGLTLDAIKKFCDEVVEFVNEKQCFTVAMLKEMGFASDLLNSNYSDWMFASILARDERFSYSANAKVIVLYKGKYEIGVGNVIEDIVKEYGSINVYDLIYEVNSRFGYDYYCVSDITYKINDVAVEYDGENCIYTGNV